MGILVYSLYLGFRGLGLGVWGSFKLHKPCGAQLEEKNKTLPKGEAETPKTITAPNLKP